jgi:hypothetical protein
MEEAPDLWTPDLTALQQFLTRRTDQSYCGICHKSVRGGVTDRHLQSTAHRKAMRIAERAEVYESESESEIEVEVDPIA